MEILVILAVVIVIFGVGRLPQIGDALGKGIRGFRGTAGDDDDAPTVESALPPVPPPTSAFCTQCGVAVAPSLRFCTACGHSLR